MSTYLVTSDGYYGDTSVDIEVVLGTTEAKGKAGAKLAALEFLNSNEEISRVTVYRIDSPRTFMRSKAVVQV